MSPTPNHSATIEWLGLEAGVIRVHPGPDGRPGDPYVWAATLARLGGCAWIKGVSARLTPSGARAVLAALHREGIRVRAHVRHPLTDRERVRAVGVRPPREARS